MHNTTLPSVLYCSIHGKDRGVLRMRRPTIEPSHNIEISTQGGSVHLFFGSYDVITLCTMWWGTVSLVASTDLDLTVTFLLCIFAHSYGVAIMSAIVFFITHLSQKHI